MSRETDRLELLAAEERRQLGLHVQRLPGRTGDALSAFVRKHPFWTMGGAAALAVYFASRRRKRLGPEAGARGKRLPAALGAIVGPLLPELLKLLHLTVPKSGASARAGTNGTAYRAE
jgi:hypothetical protein